MPTKAFFWTVYLKNKFKWFYYINIGVSPLVLPKKKLSRFVWKILAILEKPFLMQLIETKQMFFFDCVDFIEKFYRIKIPLDVIYNIPMNIEELNIDKIKSRYNNEDFLLFTSARADFPFKGYIFGLIEMFKTISIDKRMKLIIISSGAQDEMIKKRINDLNDDVKQKITFINGESYDKVIKHMEASNLVIGMGTTVLDAASRGIPVINVVPYTFELMSSGLWNGNRSSVNTLDNVIAAVNKVMNSSLAEYECISRNTYAKCKEKYDINVIMEDVIKKKGCDSFNLFNNLLLLWAFILRLLIDYVWQKKQRYKFIF